MAQSRRREKGRRQGNSTPQKKNNSIEELVGNEYPVPDPNRVMINITNELNELNS
jgi:hypothetical protein